MTLVVVLEHRFDRTPDGAIWTQTTFPYAFWELHLEVFDRVRIVARARDVESPPPGGRRVEGTGVEFAGLPDYVGPSQYLTKARAVARAVRAAVGPDDALLLRVCSPLSGHLDTMLRRNGRPFGVVVVADPHDVFAPGSVKHVLRPFFQWWFPRRLRDQCVRAGAVSYVTRDALQGRYPPSIGAFSTHFSDVDLPDDAFVAAPRPVRPRPRSLTLITVGTLAQLYKAPDVLIDAVASCVRGGLDARLVLIGDGKHRSELEARGAGLGLGDRVRFLGQLPAGSEVVAQLDRADVFVLPSYQEGLPRAMIEAMARGLPCIGSTVGGIPELLAAEDLVPPGHVGALARKIREVVDDPERLAAMSARNLDRAGEYRAELLHQRRVEFLRRLRALTAEWSSGKGRAGSSRTRLQQPVTS